MSDITKAISDARQALLSELIDRSQLLTYSRACDRNADEVGDRTALIDRSMRFTWAEVRAISDRLAMALLERGVMRPDIALIHLSNSAEQYLIRLACEKAGVRALLTNSAFREAELVSLVERTRPAIAFLSAGKAQRGDYDRLRAALEAAGLAVDAILVGGGPSFAKAGVTWGQPYERLLADAPSAVPRVLDRTRFGWDERFYLTTTSGSTSAPKIADTIFGHRIWLSLRHARGMKLAPGETIAALPPMTSGTSDTLIHHAAPYFAATMVLEARFDPEETVDLLIDEGVHVATAVPAMLARMVAKGSIDRLADAPLRCFATYASSISYDIGAAVETRARCGVVRCYGTMDFGGISMTTLDDDREVRIRTVGKPFDVNEVHIVDEHGRDVAPGAEGEIVMRPSRVVMGCGYYRDLASTRKSWTDDFYRLGDLGRLDADGNLVLVGRASELIIRGGQNIVPAEIEELLMSHANVSDAVVVGVPDEVMGERVCACIIPKAGETVTVEDARRHFEALGVASFKCPEMVVPFEEFPLAMSGMKVDRRQLVAMLTTGT